MLADALEHHRGPLRASLRAEYGIDLDHPGCGATALAEYTAELPPGCALWRSIGGPLAWTTEATVLHALDYRLQVLAWMQTEDSRKNRNRPEPHQPPAFAHEKRADEQRYASRAAAWRARNRT